MTWSVERILLVFTVVVFGRLGFQPTIVIAVDLEAPSSSSSTLSFDYNSNAVFEEIQSMVLSGKLSSARRRALEVVWENPKLKAPISKAYVDSFHKAFREKGNIYLQEIHQSANSIDEHRVRLQARRDDPHCVKDMAKEVDLASTNVNELWDESCSILPPSDSPTQWSLGLSTPWEGSRTPFVSSVHPCCEFGPDSWAYLRLPTLHEPAVRLNIPQLRIHPDLQETETTMFLDLEQDGYIRLFDVDGILWPSGYLLSLCLGDVMGCPIPELHELLKWELETYVSASSSKDDCITGRHPPLAIELGAGIGAPSIALSKSLQRMGFSAPTTCDRIQRDSDDYGPFVLATDVSPFALALTMSNAAFNNVSDTLSTAPIDHFNETALQEVKNRFFPSSADIASIGRHAKGFSLVMGSSLQALFQDSGEQGPLWAALEILLDMDNPRALAIFVHTRTERLDPPMKDSIPFRLIRRVSGSLKEFGKMITRTNDPSDFEICIFKPIVGTSINEGSSFEL